MVYGYKADMTFKMYNMAIGRSFMTVVFIVLANCVTTVHSQCQFPDALQNIENNPNDYWRNDVMLDDTGNRARFYGGTYKSERIQIVSANSTDQMMWSCLNTTITSDGKRSLYLMKLNNTDANNKQDNESPYLCAGYVQLTPNVIRFSTISTIKDEPSGPLLCNEEEETWSDSPLISNIDRNTSGQRWQTCNMNVGGYDIKQMNQTVRGDEKELCKIRPNKGFAEVDCLTGEGILIEFPHVTCIPQFTGWETEQKLHCLSSWTEMSLDNTTEYKFALLGKEYFDPKWCMRIDPSEDETNYKITIFQDMFCPITNNTLNETRSFISLNVDVKQEDSSTNDDGSNSISLEQFKGTWFQYEDGDYQANITIQNSSIFVENFGAKLDCLSKSQDKHITKALTSNGCRPRYQCMHLESIDDASSVIMYKLGKSSFVKSNDLCTGSNFEDDEEPLRDTFRSRYNKFLILDTDDILKTAVSCGDKHVTATVNITIPEGANGTSSLCEGQGHLDGCQDPKGASIDVPCLGNKTWDFTCLARYEFGPNKDDIVIVYNDNKVKCWINRQNSPLKYIMQSPQCNVETYYRVESGNRQAAAKITFVSTANCIQETSSEAPTVPITVATSETPTDDTGSTVSDEPNAHSTADGSEPTGAPTPDPSPSPTDTSIEPPSSSSIASSTVANTEMPDNHKGLSAGGVVGVVFAVIIICGLLGVGGWFAYRAYIVRRTPYRVL